MFFEKEMLSFNLLDVLEFNQTNVNTMNRGRNFSALSFRLCSDAVLTTETSEFCTSDRCVCYVPAGVDYKRVASVDELIVVHFEATNYSAQGLECFTPSVPDTLEKLFREILECWNQKTIGYRYRCSALLYEILAECYAQNYVARSGNSKIQNSVDFILKSYKDPALSMREIAAKSYMSEVYFRKLFKKEYGISPQKYVVNLRIQNAKGLIVTGYYSLKEVADLSGYADYKYFSAEFKRIVGVSPSKYRYNFCEPKIK